MRATILISLEIEDSPRSEEILNALESLAEIMAIQAEDGLWSHGSPESWNDDDANVYVSDISAVGDAEISVEWSDR